MQRQPAKLQWNWNSPWMIGFDVLFGVIPACLIAMYTFVVGVNLTGDTMKGRNSEDFLYGVALLVIGFVPSVALLRISGLREKARPKWLFISLLVTGIVAIPVFFIWDSIQLFDEAGNVAWGLRYIIPVLVSFAIIAIKHIIMLSQNQVRSVEL